MADGMTQEPILAAPPSMEMSAEFTEFAKAMPAAQKALGDVIKKVDNGFTNKKYADLSAVVDAVIGPMNDAGFSIIQSPATDDGGRVQITTLVLHVSGQWLKSTLQLRPQKADPQGIGSAITYGRRYSLMGIAGVAPEDDDGNAASQPKRQEPRNQRQAPPPQQPEAMDPRTAQIMWDDLYDSLHQTTNRDEQTAWFRSNKTKIESLPADLQESLNTEMRVVAEKHKATT